MDNNEPDEIREPETSAEVDNESEQNQTSETQLKDRPINLNLPEPLPDYVVSPTLHEALQQAVSAAKSLRGLYNSDAAKQIAAAARASALMFESFSHRILEIYSSSWFTNLSKQIELIHKSISVLVHSIDYSGIQDTVSKHIKQTEEIIDTALFEAEWIPYVRYHMNWSEYEMIFDILCSTKEGSKNRTKKVDHLVFEHYNKKQFVLMKRKWRESGIPYHIYRILSQCIEAYNAKQYALALPTMVMIWEKLISLVSNCGSRTDQKAKQAFSDLIDQRIQGANYLIKQFFNDYVYYPCYDEKDVNDNVPGRHGIAHGWLKKYPTRKAALNAILLTDLIVDCLKNSKLNQEENSEKGEDNG